VHLIVGVGFWLRFLSFFLFLSGGGRGVEDSAKDTDQVLEHGNPLGKDCGLSSFAEIP